ncbi:MAG: hypothetical protein AABY75_09635, partial [Bacteroidota bacterium]
SELVTHRGGTNARREPEPQISLFEMREDRLREALRGVDPNSLTPIQALQLIEKLKREFDIE